MIEDLMKIQPTKDWRGRHVMQLNFDENSRLDPHWNSAEYDAPKEVNVIGRRNIHAFRQGLYLLQEAKIDASIEPWDIDDFESGRGVWFRLPSLYDREYPSVSFRTSGKCVRFDYQRTLCEEFEELFRHRPKTAEYALKLFQEWKALPMAKAYFGSWLEPRVELHLTGKFREEQRSGWARRIGDVDRELQNLYKD
jgi:hypothetical protein